MPGPSGRAPIPARGWSRLPATSPPWPPPIGTACRPSSFPAGDCRNAVPHSTEVTDGQIGDLIGEFDQFMHPTETTTFSTPPGHNGSRTLRPLAAAGLDFAGDGSHTVTLVDNVRDPNFYEFPKNKTYVAGFFAPIFNKLTDRNVMTIDAFDCEVYAGYRPAVNGVVQPGG
jgi:hypothetical protein